MSLIGIIMFVKLCLSECTDDDTERCALIFIVSIELKALLEKNFDHFDHCVTKSKLLFTKVISDTDTIHETVHKIISIFILHLR